MAAINTSFSIFDPTTDTAAVIESKSITFANNLVSFVPELNNVVSAFNFNATNSTSASSETIGAGSRSLTVEAGKSYVGGMWVTAAYTADATEWMAGPVTGYDSGTGALTFSAIETSGHSSTRSAWTVSQARPNDGQKFYREARTSNSSLSNNDYGKFIDITSGTFTQGFLASSTLTNGWWARIRNGGTGDITLDPNSTETIDGRTTFIMYPGEIRDIYSDGSNLYSIVVNPFFRRITSTYASMPIPPGYTRFGIRAWSGGSSGQRTNNAGTMSRGGAGGGCIEAVLPASSFSSTETITIGAGGAAVTTVANGNPGGDTTFGSLLSVYGGNSWVQGGSCVENFVVTDAASHRECVYAGGATSSATPFNGIYGGADPSANATQDSGSAVFAGAAGGSLSSAAVVRAPGTSAFGGDGGAALSASNGTAGSQPGGGGGATQTGTQSGAGGDGEVWFWGVV